MYQILFCVTRSILPKEEKKLQIDNALDSSIDGESIKVERDGLNKHLQNGIASKAHKNLHTVQVDIH